MKTKLFLLFTLSCVNSFAQITSTKSGNWNDPTVWSTGIVPGSLDDVQIISPHTVTLTVTDTICVYHIASGATLTINSNTVLFVNNNGCTTTGGGISAANKYNNLGTITGGGSLLLRGSAGSDMVISNNGTITVDTVTVENYLTTSYDVNFQNGNSVASSYQANVTILHTITGDDCYFYNYSTVSANVFVVENLNTTWDSYVAIENKAAGTFTANAIFLNNSNATLGLSFLDNYGNVTLGSISTATSVTTIPFLKNESNATFNFIGASIGTGVRLDPGYPGSTVCYCSATTQQTIAVPQYGTSGTVSYYENLTLNSQGAYPQLTMAGATQVNSTLTMTFGIVNMAGFMFTLGNNTPTTGTLVRSNGHFYGGTFRRYYAVGDNITLGTASGLFPLGTSYNNSQTFYRPYWFGALSLTGGSMNVSHTYVYSPATTSTAFTDATWAGGTLIQGVTTSFWTVSRTFSSAGGNKYMRYGGQGFGTNSLADLDATQSNSATVGFYAAPTNVNTTVEVNRIITADAEFSNTWYIGTKDIVSSPLPVSLLTLNAAALSKAVEVTWTTATEINNDYFILERSEDGKKFMPIAVIPGNGNSDHLILYEFLDVQPKENNYYRLLQMDYNGTSEYCKQIAYAGFKTSAIVNTTHYNILGQLVDSDYTGIQIERNLYDNKDIISKIIKK